MRSYCIINASYKEHIKISTVLMIARDSGGVRWLRASTTSSGAGNNERLRQFQ
jgi:hypothetical protein